MEIDPPSLRVPDVSPSGDGFCEGILPSSHRIELGAGLTAPPFAPCSSKKLGLEEIFGLLPPPSSSLSFAVPGILHELLNVPSSQIGVDNPLVQTPGTR